MSSFVYSVKTQLGDQEGLGGKINEEDKKTLLSTVKDATDWIDEHGSSASVEDLEEKLAGASYTHIRMSVCHANCELRTEVQSVVNPITTKLYQSAGGDSDPAGQEPMMDHDEL